MGENFLSLIKMCRSVRAYKSESVPSKALDAVLEAGTYPAQEDGQPAARKQNYERQEICPLPRRCRKVQHGSDKIHRTR